VFPYS
jgi:hypothetical protein